MSQAIFHHSHQKVDRKVINLSLMYNFSIVDFWFQINSTNGIKKTKNKNGEKTCLKAQQRSDCLG